MPEPVCVRCGAALLTPGEAGAWTCERHGVVEPLHAALPPEPHHLADVASSSAVPVWIPWPVPAGWSVTGVRRTGGTGLARAVAVALSGPGLLGRQADLVLVAEEPGVGLGAAYAGLTSTDPGPELASLPSDTRITADGHQAALWSLPAGDRSVYVGEAAGCWLWVVAHPVGEWMVVHDDLRVVDLRLPENRAHLGAVPLGALSPWLSA